MARDREQPLRSTLVFKILAALISVGLVIQFTLVFYHANNVDVDFRQVTEGEEQDSSSSAEAEPLPASQFDHLDLPPLPANKMLEDTGDLVKRTLDGTRPTIAGIAIILQRFLLALHDSNKAIGKVDVVKDTVVKAFLRLAEEHLLPLDKAYRGRPVFPVRMDDSIYVSVAAYRDHLLGETLKNAFSQAQHPEKLFIGAIVQNCFGIEETCRTGVQVVGKNKQGKDMTKVSDAPPDVNGIEQFCTDPDFIQYCNSGQIRALYVNETEAAGPAVARYFASKLWGGETFFIQVDAHLQFAKHWDARYIDEIKATASYPKSILSAYPPGFGHNLESDTPGTRLCSCQFSWSDVEHDIIRINTGHSYQKGAPKPTQIAFIAAGFFMARAEFLTDIPFDPLLPWCFMGEEIALSMRSWTAGWNIYAPRLNLISHQYRPGRMGLPKFWESVGRTFGRPGPGFSNAMQSRTIQRIKYMVGYPDVTREWLQEEGGDYVLLEIENYGMGNKRPREDYLSLTTIDFETKKCGQMKWCNMGELE